MKVRLYILLFLLSLVVVSAAASFELTPGYMDAEYYTAGGMRLAEGSGFTEPFLWNYLDAPQSIPHASHVYWMPLASVVAALGVVIGGASNFLNARLPFLLFAGAIAPFTAWISFRLSGKKSQALLAGFLAIFAGFYLPYYATTDTFALYMLFGGSFIVISGILIEQNGTALRKICLAGGLGLLAGLMHLTRADGIVWFGIGILVVLYAVVSGKKRAQNPRELAHQENKDWVWTVVFAALAAGYLIVMGAWYLRNLDLYGLPFSPGSGYTLWLTNYDQTFSYHLDGLSFKTWIASGIGNILSVRWKAFSMNIQTAFIVENGIFLVPLVIAGWWQHRRDAIGLVASLSWLVTFLVMTFAFPFAGSRGGFLHSGAAVQPLCWALAPAGLDALLRWASRVRRWNYHQALRVFSVGTIILAVIVSGIVFFEKVIGDNPGETVAWNQAWTRQSALGAELDAMDLDPQAIYMVNNPPGFYLATGRSSVVIPYGDIQTVLEAANVYQVEYLLLDENHVDGLDPLYADPSNLNSLTYLKTIDGTQIYRINRQATEK